MNETIVIESEDVFFRRQDQANDAFIEAAIEAVVRENSLKVQEGGKVHSEEKRYYIQRRCFRCQMYMEIGPAEKEKCFQRCPNCHAWMDEYLEER